MRFRTYYYQGNILTSDIETEKVYICEKYSKMKEDISALVLSGAIRLSYIEDFPVRTFTYINFLYEHCIPSRDLYQDIEFQQLMSILQSVDLEIALKNKDVTKLICEKIINYGVEYFRTVES